MQILAFLMARAKEPSSYAGVAMLLTAAGVHYSTDEFTAVVNGLVAVAGAVAVFLPESRAGLGGGTRMLAPILLLGGLAGVAAACSSATVASDTVSATAAVNSVVATANADVAALQPVFQTICAGGAWADAQFQVVSGVANLGAGVAADEAKAMAALDTLCSAPPANVATAVSTATALYKQITTATPVVTAAPAVPASVAAPAAPAGP